MIKKIGFWLPLAVCTYLALMPNPQDVVGGVSDVLLHASAFSYLTAALWFAHFGKLEWRPVAGWMLAYGVALELTQGLLPDRSAEIKDLAVDFVGILIGCAVYLAAQSLMRRAT